MSTIYGNPLLFGGGTVKQPKFEYTGDYTTRTDGVVELRSSGIFTSLQQQPVDVFLVGGGGAGRAHGGAYGSAGGGGGFTLTSTILLSERAEYEVTIGAGGADIGVSSSIDYASSGGTTSFGVLTVAGGTGGRYQYRNGGTRHDGGNGGSGGGASAKGGVDGSAGNLGQDSGAIVGTGQGTTTREFGEATGKLYSGGGTAVYNGTTVSSGVDGGGGASNSAGTPNTGGGGGASGGDTSVRASFAGGSGIVCIRLHKES